MALPGRLRAAPLLTLFVLVLAAAPAAALTDLRSPSADAAPQPPTPVAAQAPTASAALPRVRHVFVINLENKGYEETFGAGTKAPYLAKTLRSKGLLLPSYYGIGHNSLPNYLAQLSGQAPNPQTQGDCQVFSDFQGSGTVAPGQAVGNGCVYPARVKTVADQLTASGRTWKGYLQDMADARPYTCRHPAIGSRDTTQSATKGDQYAARHNPFVYFHSLLDSGECAKRDVPLARLVRDLRSVATTPNLSYITPDLCSDAHDAPCADGRPGGLASANSFLSTYVPKILASPAFRRDGLLVVTFDEAEASGGSADASACCGEQPGPNSPLPGIAGPGGGRVGAVLVSPFVRPGSTSTRAYNHYSLLAGIEDLFGLPYLGYAGQAGLPRFGSDVYATS